MTSRQWPRSLVDPYRGIAFFDGIHIEADPLSEIRYDKVLPVVEEEHVAVCRSMSATLRAPGNIAVDIGTGSGLYAIWAAQRGYRVVAIDRNPRAVLFAQQNAGRNGVRVRTATTSHALTLAEIEAGEILLLLGNVEDILDTLRSQADLVLLSPPYVPNLNGAVLAQYAAGGIDGQADFRLQSAIAADMLRPGGVCFGNQLTLSSIDHPLPEAVLTLNRVFGRGASVQYEHLLPHAHQDQILDYGSREVESFVRSMYRGLAAHDEARLTQFFSDSNAEFERVRSRVLYSLIQYCAQRPSSTVAPISPTFVKKPNASWASWLDYMRRATADPDMPQSGSGLSFFLSDRSYAPSSLDSPQNTRDEPHIWLRPQFGFIDDWIRRHLNPSEEGDSCGDTSSKAATFSGLILDTSPFFRPVLGDDTLWQNVALWSGSTPEDQIQLVERYLKVVRTLQAAKIRLFLHPAFTGAGLSGAWRPLHMSLRASWGSYLPSGPLHRQIDEAVANIRTRFNEAEKELEAGWSRWFSDNFLPPKPDTGKTTRDPIRILSRGVSTWTDFGTFFDDQGVSRANREQAFTEDIASLLHDYSAAQHLLHEKLHERIAGADLRPTQKNPCSWLISLPLTLGPSLDTSCQIGKVPKDFRGGAWLFAWSDDWSQAHESALTDLFRMVWLELSQSFNYEATSEAARIGAHAQAETFSHEIKQVTDAFTGGAFLSVGAELVSCGTETHNMLGIEDCEEWSGARLAPFPEVIDAARSTLLMWNLRSRQDQFFDGREIGPMSFQQFVDRCWDHAKKRAVPRLFAKRDVSTADGRRELRRLLRCMDKVLWPHGVAAEADLEPDWSTPEATTFWMKCGMIMTHALFNVVRHAHPFQPVTVTASLNGDYVVFEVCSGWRGGEPTHTDIENWFRSHRDEIGAEWQEYARAYDTIVSALGATLNQAVVNIDAPSGESILIALADELHGSVETSHGSQDGEQHRVVISVLKHS